MNWLFDLLDRMRAAYRARRVAQATADLQRGKDILDQAQAEAQEMRAAADAMEERKRLTTSVAGVPVVPPPAAPAAEVSPHGGAQPPAERHCCMLGDPARTTDPQGCPACAAMP